ncbi:hypothetical protein Vafri_6720 [Volvox africanus]|nr:hypothetical protein Vafri_6720 [Volvox africanus]
MPAHQVGSLDSWLESPSNSCGLGRPLFQVCQTRPRTFLGGSSKSVPVEDCAISLGTNNKGNNGPRDVGKPASAYSAVDVANSPRIASVGNDEHLDGPGTYIVVSRGASSFKRKSLLSEQLRSAASLPLPILPSNIDAEDVALETNNPTTSRTVCTRQRSTAEAPEVTVCGTQLAPLNSSISTTYAKRQASILSVYPRASQGYDETNMLKSSKGGADASPPSTSGASPSSDMYGNGCGSGDTVSYCGEGGIRVSSRSKSLLVLMSAGSMDADASSACGGAGSLACSSSTGYFSSSSNVLQYRGDRDDNSNELLYVQFSSNALMAAAAACTGAGAATCMASLATTEGHTTATLRALSAEHHKCFGDNLPEPAVLAAAPAPVSLSVQGTPVIASPRTTALSSAPRETPGPTVVCAQGNPNASLLTADTIGNTEGDVREGCEDYCSSSLAVCSATDLISGSPSGSGKEKRPSTVVQLAVAAHIAAVCSTAKDTDIGNAAIVAGQCDILSPCMATAAEAAFSGVEAGVDSSFMLLGPGAACAAADPQAPPEQAADLQGLMRHRVTLATPAGAGYGGVAVTAVPAVSAVAAHLLMGGVEGRGASAAGAAPEPTCFEAESRTLNPSMDDPAAEGMKDRSAPQAKMHLKFPGEERPKLSMEQLAGQPGAGSPAEPEASPRSPRGIPLSNLFPTVMLVPVTHSFSHAAHPYGATGRTIQHSMSLDCRTSGASLWGVEDAGEPTTAVAVCLGDAVNARRSFDISTALSRTKSSGVSGSRKSINGLLEADIDPAMYEGTVRHGLPRKAAALALARTKSQPVPEEVDE